MITTRQLYNSSHSKILSIYPDPEAQQLVFWLLEHFLGLSRADIIRDKAITEVPEALYLALKDLESGKPIQYILGLAPFYGREFKVSPEVLIPRNETEELVHLIIQENQQPNLKILDIGTGSGCIPISLSLEMPQSEVQALDISTDALAIAKDNASRLNAKINFYQADILNDEIPAKDLDILVSNPPYVRDLEKSMMRSNVLDHEPNLALFVRDDDPLIFYRTIAQKGLKALKPGGKLYFEINEALGEEMIELVKEMGYLEVSIHKDLHGKDRMLSATKR
ncbi:peptide chain release factor N(5)-glutamine methyltransferase [Echinicola marina]|uniref:peptide chain release factor N(5)-glutamine methyltransferase n=1 Tax=Echinicola marina TaxID=2859768 RepID=UPI001CF6E637|nr:peptide chain release factor N(5)-glutamine methyltransferase [Echinicola marina]UCS94761.1 peptide chain release factor N(5)-glutamine methyltransferase [Echinicola marina]